MTLTDIKDRLRIKRRDRTKILNKTILSSGVVIPNSQPSFLSAIVITVSGATTFGTITVRGLDSNKINQEETLTFTANGEKQTSKFFRQVNEFNCVGWTGEGFIEARTNQGKDFEDDAIEEAINTGIVEYSRYKPSFKTQSYTVNPDNQYSLPSNYLWIQSVYANSQNILYKIEDGKLKLIALDIPSYSPFLQVGDRNDSIKGITEFTVNYCVKRSVDGLNDIEAEMVLLRADAECDRMLATQPDRFSALVVNVPGIEILKISDVYQKSFENKMKLFREQVSGGYCVHS